MMRPRFTLNDLHDLYSQGRFADLVTRCDEIVRELRARDGADTLGLAFALEDLAFAHFKCGEHASALEHLGEALQIESAVAGLISEPCFRTLMLLGRIYTETGRLDEAESVLNRALTVFQHLPMPERRGYSHLLIQRARLAAKREDLSAAEQLLLEAAKTRASECGTADPRFGMVFDQLSVVYWKMGNRLAAERSIRKAIRIYRDASETENAAYGMMVAWLGRLAAEHGRIADARAHYSEGLDVLRRVRQPGDIRITTVEQWLLDLQEGEDDA